MADNKSQRLPIRLTEIPLKGNRAVYDPEIKKAVLKLLRIKSHQLSYIKVIKRSLDRRCRPIVTLFNVLVNLSDEKLEEDLLRKIHRRHKPKRISREDFSTLSPQTPLGKTIIVGAGPAGLAAAWALSQQRREVVVIERGDDVDRRLPTVGHFWARGLLDPQSNACFGEGGAGAFSDGKLVSRNRSRFKNFILKTWVDFGAHSDILYESQPHVGSDRLRRIIKTWREQMKLQGVEFKFRNQVTDLIVHERKVLGVVLENGEEILGDRVMWAVGGHARDSLEILLRHGVCIKPRSLAVGVRVEHPQILVNQALAGYEKGPACEYKLKTRIEGRGVYSFCMCPGGVVVAAASALGQQVVNGMSCHGKKSPYANSALVVEVSSEQFPEGPLGGLDYQRQLERCAYNVSKKYLAPAQRLTDFLEGTLSSDLPKSSYRPGLIAYDLRDVLPQDVSRLIKLAMPEFARQLKGYVTKEALLLAVETRTSCPITVVRDDQRQSTLKNLYCVGEGAGFAGGILSAAYDALEILSFLGKQTDT